MQAVNNSTEKNRLKKKHNLLKEDTIKKIDLRESMKLSMHASQRAKEEYSEQNKLIKRKIRNDLRDHNKKKVKDIIEQSKSVKKVIKELTEGKHWMLSVNDRSGKKITSRTEISRHATEYYNNL